MRQDLLSHTLTVRIEPALHAELILKAERVDLTMGELVRRAIRARLEEADAKAMAPRPSPDTSCSRGE